MPRLFVLTAPAGYCKTTTALAYASAHKSHACVDLERTPSARALLLALLNALSSGSAGDSAYLRQAQLSLAADETVPATLAERVLDMWRDPGTPAAVVFDNAERLSPQTLPLFNRIIERRPAQRACIVCSDTPLALRTPAISSPSEMMHVTAGDLALSEEQTRALFADSALPGEQLRNIINLTQGWPLAALLLRYLHSKGRLSAALTGAQKMGGLEGFYQFVQGLVIESLPGDQRRVLEFCAAVPDVQVSDLRVCLGSPAVQALYAAAGSVPLIRVENERVEVHPLLRTAMAPANQHAVEDLRAGARAALRRDECGVAVERFIACGDRLEATKVLDDALEHGSKASVAAAAVWFDRRILERHPRWFVLTALLRRYDVPPGENLAFVQAHRARVEKTGDAAARFAIGALETHQLLHCGFLEQVQEGLQELDTLLTALKRGGIVNALRAHVAARFVDALRGALAVAIGEVDRGERLLKRAHFATGQFSMMALSATADGWLPIGLIRGDVRLIQSHCARARESLKRAGLDIALIDLDTNQAFAGWALGDDLMYEESIRRVDARARAYRTSAFDHLLGAAGLREPSDATGLEPLRRLIIAHLLAAARADDREGLDHARRALLFARELRNALFTALAAIAVRERGGDPGCEQGETLALAPRLEASFAARMSRRDEGSGSGRR
ncbi:MAG TPA: hypothetical protein VFN37_04925 [Candidatus Baltobacteraceae bacterium]|nr:hypothetical protein [Candidatus Baltobacteraceae bacterium]